MSFFNFNILSGFRLQLPNQRYTQKSSQLSEVRLFRNMPLVLTEECFCRKLHLTCLTGLK